MRAGFTLVEIMIVVAIIATLASIAVPAFARVSYRAQIVRAISDIKTIESDLALFELEHGRLPADLSEIDRAGLRDPWKRPYEYMMFPGEKNKVRKDHSLHPLNSNYDLYSKGRDGDSKAPLTANASRDDIIRANDGGYLGLASGY